MERSRKIAKKNLEDFTEYAFDILTKIIGLSHSSSHEDKLSKKSVILIVYSSSLLLSFTAGSLLFRQIIFTGKNDILEQLIQIIYYCLNIFLLTITFYSHIINERVYWRLRYDIDNIHGFTVNRNMGPYIRNVITCVLILMAYIYAIYPIFNERLCPKSGIDIWRLSTAYFSSIYATVAVFKIILLLCKIKGQYIVLNENYDYFNADSYFISDYKSILGRGDGIRAIQLGLFRKYKATHLALTELVNLVSENFSFVFLVDLTRAFCVMYFAGFWLVRDIYDDSYEAEKEILFRELPMFLQLVKIFALASVCSGIEVEFERSKLKLDKILDCCETDEMLQECVALANMLRTRVRVTAGGMFMINYNMLLEMVGGLLTNFVLILQLRFPGLISGTRS